MNNLLSYSGLVDARISASDKDLPVYFGVQLRPMLSICLLSCMAVNLEGAGGYSCSPLFLSDQLTPSRGDRL